MPPRNPIILIRSNVFNMAAVSVKTSIVIACLAGRDAQIVLYTGFY